MMKRFLPALAIGLGLLLGSAVPAEAATKDEIKEQKAQVKMLAKELKTFDKNKSKWMKATDKGKDTAKMDAAMIEIASRNLGWLRGTHNIKKDTAETDDNKWHVAFRDVCLDIKHNNDKDVRKKQIEKMSQMLDTRLQRHEKKLDKMGG